MTAIRDDVSVLGDDTRALVETLRAAADDGLQRNPYVVLGAAFGVGLVLGGGLPFGVVRRAAMLGVGAAMSRMTNTMLEGLLSDAGLKRGRTEGSDR